MGGSVIYSVPMKDFKMLSPLFKLVTKSKNVEGVMKELSSLVKDCGISHASIEEVFLAMTTEKKEIEVKEESPDCKGEQ